MKLLVVIAIFAVVTAAGAGALYLDLGVEAAPEAVMSYDPAVPLAVHNPTDGPAPHRFSDEEMDFLNRRLDRHVKDVARADVYLLKAGRGLRSYEGAQAEKARAMLTLRMADGTLMDSRAVDADRGGLAVALAAKLDQCVQRYRALPPPPVSAGAAARRISDI
ncbi:MAG: hypothetical protein H0S85_16635 [Desulfovibrionaceae bacterium]|jgi:hypothetical protein|nr:hypothetical protein [Desulfovibrionaceae bacterium]